MKHKREKSCKNHQCYNCKNEPSEKHCLECVGDLCFWEKKAVKYTGAKTNIKNTDLTTPDSRQSVKTSKKV